MDPNPSQVDRRQRALVKNAADPKQIKFAEQVEKRRAERFGNAMNAVMSTPEGRIVMAQLIRRAGVYRSVWSHGAEIHYNAGKQDYGHELMADLIGVNEQLYQVMEREEWQWNRQQERSVDAAHAQREPGRADIGGSDDGDN